MGVSENGIVKINNVLNTTNYKGDIPRIGMRMQLPKKYENLTYFGRGPWENYKIEMFQHLLISILQK